MGPHECGLCGENMFFADHEVLACFLAYLILFLGMWLLSSVERKRFSDDQQPLIENEMY